MERFHRSLSAGIRHRGGLPQQLNQWAPLLADSRQEYNPVRPHEALQMQVPAQRCQPSRRAYQARPRGWDYGKGITVVRVGLSGNVSWHLTPQAANPIRQSDQWSFGYAVCYTDTHKAG